MIATLEIVLKKMFFFIWGVFFVIPIWKIGSTKFEFGIWVNLGKVLCVDILCLCIKSMEHFSKLFRKVLNFQF